MATEEDFERARRRLAIAIDELDRIHCDLDGEPRASNEVLTHWVVVTSHLQVDGDMGDDATQVSMYRSDGLVYWMTDGLLNAARKSIDDDYLA